MNWQGRSRPRVFRWAILFAAISMVLGVSSASAITIPIIGGGSGSGTGSGSGSTPGAATPTTPSTPDPGDLPISPEWLVNTLGHATNIGSVQNNPIPGAIAERDQAVAQWKAAEAAYKARKGPQPNPLAKPEYNVVWASKQNVADVNSDVVTKFLQAGTINPQGLLDMLNPQFAPGLDGFAVIDVRPKNLDATDNPQYGQVVNFVQLPLPWGIENEAHHMQYEWHDGDPILAGGLYTGTTHVLDASDIPNLKLLNEIPNTQTPGGTIADAYENGPGGRFYLTLMGGPLSNFGGSPGELVTFKRDPVKGVVVESEAPAGAAQAAGTGANKNPNDVPEPCSLRESRPLGTCANPHGIQFRNDLNVGLTSDYAEPREIVLDPVKTVDKYAFRPTVRTWDTSGANADKPKLIGVGHVPNGPTQPAQRAHEQYGIMENGKTQADATKYRHGLASKGFFLSSMCGGGVFFIPDITKAKGDFSDKIVQVWNDGITNLLTNGDQDINDPSGCDGGSWTQVAPNNRILFHTVTGRNPDSDNYFDEGAGKMVYDINIAPLIKSAQDGSVDCDLSRGIHKDGYDLTGMQLYNKLAQGKHIADCPRFISSLKVQDTTSGGPHWAAFDNHTIDQNGVPWRLTFMDYFVSRTGVDGNHRFYGVNVGPHGKLSYDRSLRDEKEGSLGVDFNRRDWPGNPDAGFYKPHSQIWVCPPGICPDNAPAARRKASTKP